jgi:Tfp pilus assembly protein PilW
MRAGRLRDERGFTVIELLVGMTISMATVTAAFAMLSFVMRSTSETVARVDATQRARIAMDEMTRSLRSQVCRPAILGAVESGTPTTVTYYVDHSSGTGLLAKHTLTFTATGRGSITHERFDGGGTAAATTWNASPDTRRVLLDNVTTTKTTPVLRYYAATADGSEQALATPLTTADRSRVARIKIAFTAKANSASGKGSIAVHDEVWVRGFPPNETTRTDC